MSEWNRETIDQLRGGFGRSGPWANLADLNLRPGDKIEARSGDRILTARITRIGRSSPTPIPQPRLSRWQRFKRRLTPRRWRPPTTPSVGFGSDTLTIHTEPWTEE